MKFLIVLSVAIACASAQFRPAPAFNSNFEKDAIILKQVYDLNPVDNSFVSSYETSNGIRQDVQGYLKNPGTNIEAQVMQGSYSYTGPDGIIYTVTWVADEEGFRADGAHLPKAPVPVVPAAIVPALRPAARPFPNRFN